MLKRVAILLFCLMMVFIATFGFVVGVVSVPTIYSYAETGNDIYIPLRNPSDLVIGFQSYCKSRDLTIEGSAADAVTTFTTGAFNGVCNTLGINISQLQAEIKAEYDQSGKPVKFLFNSTGVMAMNRIFAQFLQDNELEVGDSVSENDPKYLYQGKMVEDKYLIYVINGNGTELTNHNRITTFGVPIFNGQSLYNAGSGSFVLGDKTITHNTYNTSYADRFFGSNTWGDVNSQLTYIVSTTVNPKGRVYNSDIGICYFPAMNKYYLLLYTEYEDTSGNTLYDIINPIAINFNSQDIDDNVNVYITTNNTTINNNNYEGDTYITNEGDVINPIDDPDDPDPPGGTVPDWNIGGGDGSATDGNGNTWNITFPDFELPDLNIDWSINGLGEKFPFSIPFDLVALVTVLNAEPEAPRFEGTINFGFTTWDYDINLEQFDNVAQACRIAELLLLVVGLILITRSIIKG